MKTGEMLSTACGSPHYVAPEVLTFDGSAQYDGLLSDVWSLGILLHVMLLYRLPFEADSTQLLYKKIRQGLPSLPPSLSPAASSLLQGMLTVAPHERMTLVQVVQHEWPQLQPQGKADQPLPLFVSQTVDAVVDHFSIASPNGSESYLSSSTFLKIGSDPSSTPSSDGDAATGGMRRAFTFDVLPPPSGDDDCNDLLFFPAEAKERRRAARARGTGTAAAAAAFQLSPRLVANEAAGGRVTRIDPPSACTPGRASPPTMADALVVASGKRQAARHGDRPTSADGDSEFSPFKVI